MWRVRVNYIFQGCYQIYVRQKQKQKRIFVVIDTFYKLSYQLIFLCMVIHINNLFVFNEKQRILFNHIFVLTIYRYIELFPSSYEDAKKRIMNDARLNAKHFVGEDDDDNIQQNNTDYDNNNNTNGNTNNNNYTRRVSRSRTRSRTRSRSRQRSRSRSNSRGQYFQVHFF